MYQVLNCLVTEHDLRLVVLAGIICWLASAVAISLFHRARASQGRTRAIWVGLDAAVGGCGIWATHFVAMLAYDPGAGAGYNIPVTLMSLIFAVSIAAVGLSVALLNDRRSTIAIGGAVVGAGVAAMHYTGMMALELPARIIWSPGIVLASVVFGGVFAAWRSLSPRAGRTAIMRLAATGLLTIAIVSHHFTAMGAVTLVADPTLATDGLTISPAALSFLTAVAAVRHSRHIVRGGACSIAVQAANCTSRRSCSTRPRKHVAGTLHVRCGRPHHAVQRALQRDDGPDQHAAARAACWSTFSGIRNRSDKWDGDPDEFFNSVVDAAKAGESLTRVVTRNGRSIRVVDQPMKGGGWVATFEDITEWQAGPGADHPYGAP